MKFGKDILDIKKKFDEAGKDLLLVGGSVRDMFLGVEPKDFDFATNASVEEITKILEGHRFELQGAHFGVTRVFTESGDYEIASYREDVTFGRQPKVKLGVTMEEDARRRDFTINALYYDITTDKVIDTVWGLMDLENKIIRTPGMAQIIFAQDKLRVLRAVRMKNKIGGTYHESVRDAIISDNTLVGLNAAGEMEPIHQNRIVEEFTKGIEESLKTSEYIADMKEFGLLEQVFKQKYHWGAFVDSHSVEITVARLLTILSVLDHKGFENLQKHLITNCLFSKSVAKGIVLLLKVQNVNFRTASTLYKLRNSTNLTNEDFLEFAEHLKNIGDSKNYDNIVAFSKYTRLSNGEELKRLGFSEEALGKEQMRLEEEHFKTFINGRE